MGGKVERDDYFIFASGLSLFISMFFFAGAFGSIDEYENLITGNVVDVGVINLTVSSSVLLNFTNASINFGSGSVDSGQSSATIDTLGVVIRGNWSSNLTRFLIINLGNENLTINVSSGKTASSFIGGTSPFYEYNVSDFGRDICDPPSGFSLGTFYEINATVSNSRRVCDTFESRENITIDLNLTIPSDSNTGILSDTITISYAKA